MDKSLPNNKNRSWNRLVLRLFDLSLTKLTCILPILKPTIMNFKGLYLLSFSLLCSITAPAQKTTTLEEALSIAETNSPSMQKALLSREQSRQSLIAQKAALKAKISLSVDPLNYSFSRNFDNRYSKWYTSEYLGSFGTFQISQPILMTNTTVSLVNTLGWQNVTSDLTSDKSYMNELYLRLQQPLFTYNSQRLNLRALELGLFYDVYMAQLQVDIAKEELANTQVSRATIADKVQEGLAATVELYQADLNLSTSKSAVRNREVALENTKATFRQFIGMDLAIPLTVSVNIGNMDTLSINMQEAVDHGLQSRMELRQRKIEIENEQFNMTKIKSLNEFKGSVSLSFGYTGYNESSDKIYDSPTRSPGVGVSFNIPICDWGERKARIKAQNAVLKSKVIDMEYEHTQIITSISSICRNLENYSAQIEIEKQNQENARLAYDISLEKYRNGDLTSMDLNLYQSQLSSKKISMAQAQINYKMELLNLKIASLYDFEKGMEIATVR
jgi:outer membrane protein